MTRPMDYLPQGYPAMDRYRGESQPELRLDDSQPADLAEPFEAVSGRPGRFASEGERLAYAERMLEWQGKAIFELRAQLERVQSAVQIKTE
jgi:hypothetical protein